MNLELLGVCVFFVTKSLANKSVNQNSLTNPNVETGGARSESSSRHLYYELNAQMCQNTMHNMYNKLINRVRIID